MAPQATFQHHVHEGTVRNGGGTGTFGLAVGSRQMQWRGTLGRPGSKYRTVNRVAPGEVTTLDWTYDGTGTNVRLFPCADALTCLCLPVDGSLRLRQRGSDFVLTPGYFALFTTGEPLTVQHSARSRTLCLFVPTSRLASAPPELASPRPIAGVADLLVRHVLATMRVGADLDSGELAAASLATAELLSATLSRKDELLARIDGYIDSRLADPELSVEQIAAAHHISVRTLHRVFSHRGQTVSAHIRARRLDRCRAELLARPDVLIGTICAKWGITDVAHFSRQYKARFGCTPSESRGTEPVVPRALTR